MAGLDNQSVLQAFLRKDLTSFVAKVFGTVVPGDRYLPNWHIDAITFQLTRCKAGEINRLLITQPPRSLKSICTSVAFVAWVLGHDPSKRFVCVSYSQELSLELARQFRLVVNSDWFKALFPNMRLSKDAKEECVTTKNGGRLATSIGGTITGRGADIIIIDDPMKAEEAKSDAVRKKVIDWYSGTLTTRLNDKKTGSIIIVMQRLHEEDLAGYVTAEGKGPWERLNLPAIATEDEEISIGPAEKYKRQEGELLQAEREPMEALDRAKSDLGSLGFSAQYQQSPLPLEGNFVKRAWLKYYENAPKGQRVRIVQSWDTASEVKATNDYSACITAAIIKRQLYVLDVWRGRLRYPDLKKKIVSHAREWIADDILIEKASAGMHLIQELQLDPPRRCPRPISIAPDGEKKVRMEAASAAVERGEVFLPNEAPWLSIFLEEILAFPNAKHDDQADAFSQLVIWAQQRKSRSVSIQAPIVFDEEKGWSDGYPD